MDSLKETLTLVLENLKNEQKGSDQEKILSLLRKALPPREFKHIKPISFRKGILKLNVDSSVWLYQLNLKKEQIKDSIKPQLDNFKDIYLRLGETK